ncbi:MAG: TlpA family protein disulfide reductase [Chloroflexi bacterium]|nr:TlpA family protein disulfide reductase [Chloroflexota bacterium]MBV9595821.1 TlpA family protein disulfide reductase [Chloroflexota bacterium]
MAIQDETIPHVSTRPWLPAALAAVSGAVVIGLLVLLWFGLQEKEVASSKVVDVPFTAAPDFTLGLFDGSSFSLSSALHSGKPVVVNFWASWCGPCADEAPVMQDAARRYGDTVTFVGVDVQDIDSDAQSFLHKYGITYLNGSGNAGSISVQYGMRGVPETYFIATDGHLVRKWNVLTSADLEQFLGELQRASGRSG